MLTETLVTRDRSWRLALLALCALAFVITFASAADTYGFGGPAWYGWWDANADKAAQPYVVTVAQPRPDGASARGGLRDGDRIDLREQSLFTRMAVAYQPIGAQPIALRLHRGHSTITRVVVPSTSWDGQPLWKLPTVTSRLLASLWFAACAALIAFRRWWHRDARLLALVLLCLTGILLDPGSFSLPNGALEVILLVLARACAAAASLLLVKLSTDFGVQSTLRKNLALAAYVAILVGFLADVLTATGLATLWFDPMPYIFRISPLRGAIDIVALVLVAASAMAAVLSTPKSQRPRAAWLLLPLPIAILASALVATLVIFIKSWFANVTVIFAAESVMLLSAFLVTYALLKRRVLDFEFVLGRTLVVGMVSLIVVASFVLLEWMLNTVLSGVSHATGLIANAVLALALGLSLNLIHKRVDALVDRVLFRKRHDDERALLDFAREAAFVTESNALLDQAIAKVKRHTDARSAAILLDASNTYAVIRSFGEAPLEISENDSAVLALKAWHKPIDPHHYQTALRGALALPMLGRGRLLGILVLGERAGGEAYAPDEIEALCLFAHGAGSSLDALATKSDGLIVSLQQSISAMAEAVATLAKENDALRTNMHGEVH